MANIKSAKKRINIIRSKTLRNKMVRSGVKTAVRKVRLAAASGDKAAAQESFRNAVSVIDKARLKGVLPKNNASRKVSRLAKLVNKMA